MGVEARYAELVGGIVDGGRIGVYRGFGRKFHCPGRGVGKSVVAFSNGRRGECGADDVRGGRETVCGDCGRLRSLRVRITLKDATVWLRNEAEMSACTASLRMFPAGTKQGQA